MSQETLSSDRHEALRRRAEAVVETDATIDGPLPIHAPRGLLHELRVHAVELAMQNDELRAGQEALAAARDAYRELYDHAPVGYVTLDSRGRVVKGNLTAAAMLAIPVTRLPGLVLPSLLSRSDADALHLHLGQALEIGEHQTTEIDLATVDGAERRLRLDTIVAEQARAPTTYRVTLTDVTERHQLEDRLRHLNRELERRVEERTAELRAADERLRTGRAMQALGRLAGGIAHDFNNLLAVILLEVEHLRGRLADSEASDGLGDIEHAARLGANLVEKLLSLARRDRASPRPCQPAVVIRELGSMLRELLGDAITLEVSADPDTGWVALDRDSLAQIVVNLVVNGRDAIDGPGAVAIEVATTRSPGARQGLPPGEYLAVRVRDTGCGMDAETRTRAIEPFFTTKGRDRGTGLGLAIVHEIVTHASGTIDLHSEVGRGTEVSIFLPRCPARSPPAPPPAAAEPPRWVRTVLVVDDDPLTLRAVRRLLETADLEVIEAASGPQALAVLADRDDIDVVLTDVVMPGMTGVELARAIEAAYPLMPVVVMSGSLFDEVATPRWHFVAKPFAAGDLLAAVTRPRRPS